MNSPNRHPALRQLDAWQASQAAERTLMLHDGLPATVREGPALAAYAWDAGELVGITEPDGTRLRYRYGDDGRLLAVDRNGEAWARYTYDAAGRLAQVDRPDGPLVHQRDAQGRLVATRRGDASAFGYRWSGAGAGPGAQARVAEAFCDIESSRFEHDAQGRLVGLTQTVDGVPLSLRLRFDAQGRLAVWSIAEWDQAIGFDWDPRGRPAALRWNGAEVARFGSDDAQRLAWHSGQGGVRSETWHDPASGRALRQRLSAADGTPLWQSERVHDEAFRLVQEGRRRHAYDAQGRLQHSVDASDADAALPGRVWRYAFSADGAVREAADAHTLQCDAAGRVRLVRDADGERVYRHNQAGELESLLVNGECVARCGYDHKGRLVRLSWHDAAGQPHTERYVYGADDGLLAVADGAGRPLQLLLRLPTGVVGVIDFRRLPQGEAISLFTDAGGNALLAADAQGPRGGVMAYCPYGLPLTADGEAAPALAMFRGRFWQPALGLYRIGARWYCPRLKRFLTPDTHTGAPDDARLVNAFVDAGAQRMARARVLGDWLRQPRLRERSAYCCADPVNRFDPDGHWSFGGVLLSLLGVLWTLPNTAFGLAVEISCLIGEVVRWLVYAVTIGHVSWQTPGFDVAASGRLNAFALVFKGGWLGSFDSLLGITFGNVIFVNGQYEQHKAFQALPDPVSPPAYGGIETIPKAQALYEHELRHVNQYSWWGPFFHLGLPLFGIYEWDVILNGYQDASLERDAREHSGF